MSTERRTAARYDCILPLDLIRQNNFHTSFALLGDMQQTQEILQFRLGLKAQLLLFQFYSYLLLCPPFIEWIRDYNQKSPSSKNPTLISTQMYIFH